MNTRYPSLRREKIERSVKQTHELPEDLFSHMWWSGRAKSSCPLHTVLDWLLELSHLFHDGGSFGEMAQGHFRLKCFPTLLRLVLLVEVPTHPLDAVLCRFRKLWPVEVMVTEPCDEGGQVVQPCQHCSWGHSCLLCIDECTEWLEWALE